MQMRIRHDYQSPDGLLYNSKILHGRSEEGDGVVTAPCAAEEVALGHWSDVSTQLAAGGKQHLLLRKEELGHRMRPPPHWPAGNRATSVVVMPLIVLPLPQRYDRSEAQRVLPRRERKAKMARRILAIRGGA